jgi:phosphoglycolate phosphatase/pyrophosphatase PpaX
VEKIKAVIFDLDGTIADTLPLCIKAFRHAVEPLAGRVVSDAEIIATFGPSEEGTIMALVPDAYEQGMADYLASYEAFHEMCPAPFEGVAELLKTLKDKGVHIAMVTGKGKSSTEISLRRFGLDNSFEIVETGKMSGPDKPRGIRSVLDYFSDVARDEAIYVGDTVSDIISSRKAGIPIVSAAWAASAEPGKLLALSPDAIFFSIADFSAWLKERI